MRVVPVPVILRDGLVRHDLRLFSGLCGRDYGGGILRIPSKGDFVIHFCGGDGRVYTFATPLNHSLSEASLDCLRVSLRDRGRADGGGWDSFDSTMG